MSSVIWSVGFALALSMKRTESAYHSARKPESSVFTLPLLIVTEGLGKGTGCCLNSEVLRVWFQGDGEDSDPFAYLKGLCWVNAL